MGHQYGGYSYLEQAKQEPLLREEDIDLNPTLNLMRQQQRKLIQERMREEETYARMIRPSLLEELLGKIY